MVLHGYFDDSFDDEYFVLAGYITTVERWSRFSKEWESLLPLAVGHDGNFRFKMSEMNRAGKMDKVFPFYRAIMDHASISLSTVLDIQTLRA